MHEDRIRNLTGSIYIPQVGNAVGILRATDTGIDWSHSGNVGQCNVTIDTSRTIPTGSYTAPRAFCSLACVYLGA